MPDSTIIVDALVQVVKVSSSMNPDTSLCSYSNWGIFSTWEYRNITFFPEAGSYELICSKEGYPLLTARATMPAIPIIQGGAVQQQGSVLSFSILRDEEVGMYEVTLHSDSWFFSNRLLRPASGDVQVSIPLDGVPAGTYHLTVYAFDLNLSEYLTVNLSIKPNIYQRDFSTVENGYGCFGALNILRKSIQF